MSQNKQPRTLRDPLDDRRTLASTIRPGSVYTYDAARPGYVDRPYGAGREMESLAQALSQFDRTLIPYLERRADAAVEKDAATGLDMFTQNPDLEKNRKDWKQLVESDPDTYAPLSPWIQKGYEQARLQALALEYEKLLSDTFTESGLNNEHDPAKLQAFVTDFDKSFRKGANLDSYEDKILLAKNFTLLSARAREGLFSRHSSQLAQQHEANLGMQSHALALKMVENALDPDLNGGVRDFADATRSGENLALIGSIVAGQVQNATEHGFRNANAPALASEMVFSLADKHGEEVLTLLDSLEINGVKLASLPDVARKREQREDRLVEKRRAATRWYWAVQEQQRKEAERAVPGQVLAMLEKQEPITIASLKEAGVPSYLIHDHLKIANNLMEAEYSSLDNNPKSGETKAKALILAKTGRLGLSQVLEAGRVFGPATRKELVVAYDTASKAENTQLTATLREGSGKLFSFFAKMPPDSYGDFLITDDQVTSAQRRGMEAAQAFIDNYERALEEAQAANKGPLSSVQLLRLNTQVRQQTFKDMSELFRAEIEEEAAKAEDTGTSPTRQAATPEQLRPFVQKIASTPVSVSPELRAQLDALYALDPELAQFETTYLNDPDALKEALDILNLPSTTPTEDPLD